MFSLKCAIDIPIAPLPQHKSQILYSLSLSKNLSASSTNTSVSPLGIKTPSSTLKSIPINSTVFNI